MTNAPDYAALVERLDRLEPQMSGSCCCYHPAEGQCESCQSRPLLREASAAIAALVRERDEARADEITMKLRYQQQAARIHDEATAAERERCARVIGNSALGPVAYRTDLIAAIRAGSDDAAPQAAQEEKG